MVKTNQIRQRVDEASQNSQKQQKKNTNKIILAGCGVAIILVLLNYIDVTVLTVNNSVGGPTEEFTPQEHKDATSATETNQETQNKGEMIEEDKIPVSSLLKYMNTAVDPCDDFYEYACGKWAEENPKAFNKLSYYTITKQKEDLQESLKGLLSAPIDDEDSTSTANVKIFYQSCVNEILVTQKGNEPLKDMLSQLGGWPLLDPEWEEKKFDLTTTLASLALYGHDTLFIDTVYIDPYNSLSKYIQFDKPKETPFGFEKYSYDDEFSYKENAYKYVILYAAVLLGANRESALKDIKDIINFEKELAKLIKKESDYFVSEKKSLKDDLMHMILCSDSFQIDWINYFTILTPSHINDTTTLMTLKYDLPYLSQLDDLLADTPKRVVANYLMWTFVSNQEIFIDRQFNEKLSRWKTCVKEIEGSMPMAVSALYVRKYFDQSSKKELKEMFVNIKNEFIDHLKSLPWLDSKSRKPLLELLKKMDILIGYPDYILNKEELDKEYQGLSFHSEKYFENVQSIQKYNSRMNYAKLQETSKYSEWTRALTLPEVYYIKVNNVIVLPAGLLHPPNYQSSYPKSMKYGKIGYEIGFWISRIIGIEMIKILDNSINDQIQRDTFFCYGPTNLYFETYQCLEDQYNKYEVPEASLKVNGTLTFLVNLLDNEGLALAFKAYEKWAVSNQEEQMHNDISAFNLTHPELFFLNYAQSKCAYESSEGAIEASEDITPDKFRVIGPLSNSEDFARAYNCAKGTRMNPEQKCAILWKNEEKSGSFISDF